VRVDLLIMFGAFVAGTLLALAFGAINTGTAFTFGQMGFAAATVYVIAKRP
jgi:predicted outer membrane lipoprotein